MTAGGHGDGKITQQGCGYRGAKPLLEPRNQGRKGTTEKYPSLSLSAFLPSAGASQQSKPVEAGNQVLLSTGVSLMGCRVGQRDE